jgi:hypothetical protein
MQPSSAYSWPTAVQTIIDAWRNWRERRRDVAAYDQADRTEVAEVARELGLSPAELRALVDRGRHSADLLQQRLRLLGIAPNRIEPGVMRDLQRCCSQCPDKVLCAHEIEDKPKGATWPRYCPNEHTIQALQADGRATGDRKETGLRPARSA